MECQASDGTAVLGSPLSFYLWSSTTRLQLSQTTLGFAGGFSCPLASYQTARIDVIANLTNPDTTPSLIQANIYGLVRHKVRTCVYTCTTQCTQDMHVLCVLCACVCMSEWLTYIAHVHMRGVVYCTMSGYTPC